MLVLLCMGSCFSESNHNTPKRRNTRTDESTMEEIKEINNMMSANDWRDRYKGITTLLEMCEINSNLVAHNIVKVCTLFTFLLLETRVLLAKGPVHPCETEALAPWPVSMATRSTRGQCFRFTGMHS